MIDNEYLAMDQLSNIVYNSSHDHNPANVSKNIILDSLIGMIERYNNEHPETNIKLVDHRKNKNEETEKKLDDDILNKINELKFIIHECEQDTSVKLYRMSKMLLEQLLDK